jgi:hypothetical protein
VRAWALLVLRLVGRLCITTVRDVLLLLLLRETERFYSDCQGPGVGVVDI